MKKLMKKIKSNKLIPKLVATLTICMVLFSSLSVSAFAADDEESAANEETESITDVWTDVMNWITSSLGSAQGVFYNEGSSPSFVLDSSDLLESEDGFYSIALPSFDPSSAVSGDSYVFSFLGVDYTLTYFIEGDLPGLSSNVFVNISDLDQPSIVYLGEWFLMLSEPFSGTATLVTPFGQPAGLSFLGTLAVVGVAIALIMLLVYVISRFLRLRG